MDTRTVQAGDTWQWTEEVPPAYPAPQWTLHLTAKNAAGGFHLQAAPNVSPPTIIAAYAETQAIAPGTYLVTRWVDNNAERYTLDQFELVVLPDPRKGADTAPLDSRTNARQILDKLEDVLIRKMDKAVLAGYTYNGLALQYAPFDKLIAIREKLKTEVRQEEQAAKLAAGLGGGGRLLVRG